MSFFGGGTNPFSTPVGQLIEKSTDPLSPDENIGLYYEICDIINLREENSKDAMRAIRKKLSIYSGKNWAVVLKILGLLEICSNNCNKKFQIQLANKDFLQELRQIISPKLQPPIVIQEKILYLIQHWANIFKYDTDFKSIEALYTELRTKGVDFPIYDPESMDLKSLTLNASPSSQKSAKDNLDGASAQASFNSDTLSKTSIKPQATKPEASGADKSNSKNTNYQRLPEFHMPSSAVKLTEEQIVKLNSELDIVDNNVQVFNEVLTQLQSSINNINNNTSDYKKDTDLLKELSKTCKEMQKRITQLIGNISNENVISELLRVNDDLNNLFVRYERFERNTAPNTNIKKAAIESQRNHETTKMDKPLIDFSDNPASDDLNQINISMTNQTSQKNLDDRDINAFLHDENEIKEMENWLKTQEGIDFHKEMELNEREKNERSKQTNISDGLQNNKNSIN